MGATHLDELHWLPGWRERSDAELVALVERVVVGERWVVEGNYVSVRSRFLERADFVLWLDLPLSTCVPRIVRRTLDRARRRAVCCNGNTERWFTLLHPKKEVNLLLWALSTDDRRRRDYLRELAPLPTVRLRSARDAAAWSRALAPGSDGTA